MTPKQFSRAVYHTINEYRKHTRIALHKQIPCWSNNDLTKIFAFYKYVPLTERNIQAYIPLGLESHTAKDILARPLKQKYRLFINTNKDLPSHWYVPPKLFKQVLASSHQWRGHSHACMLRPTDTLQWRKNIAHILQSPATQPLITPIDRLTFTLHWNGIHPIGIRRRSNARHEAIPFLAWERGQVIHTLEQYANLWRIVHQSAQDARI